MGRTDEGRFWARVTKTESCWLWDKPGPSGYGQFSAGGRSWVVHRWAYEHFVGAVPAGLVLDHLCRVRHCVRPDHLEVVTEGVNILRGIGPTARHAKATHCPSGHEYTPENTIRKMKGRYCRACKREQDKRAASTPERRAALNRHSRDYRRRQMARAALASAPAKQDSEEEQRG